MDQKKLKIVIILFNNVIAKKDEEVLEIKDFKLENLVKDLEGKNDLLTCLTLSQKQCKISDAKYYTFDSLRNELALYNEEEVICYMKSNITFYEILKALKIIQIDDANLDIEEQEKKHIIKLYNLYAKNENRAMMRENNINNLREDFPIFDDYKKALQNDESYYCEDDEYYRYLDCSIMSMNINQVVREITLDGDFANTLEHALISYLKGGKK